MTVVNAKASPAEQKAAWDFLSWLNGPKSGPNGGSAMGEILVSMGILPSRTSDAAAFADKLNDPFLKAYIAAVPSALPFPVVLGGQEFSEVAAAACRGRRVRQGERGQTRPRRRKPTPLSILAQGCEIDAAASDEAKA